MEGVLKISHQSLIFELESGSRKAVTYFEMKNHDYNKIVGFKIKCNAVGRYNIKPVKGFIHPLNTQKVVAVMELKEEEQTEQVNDKFRVLYITIDEEELGKEPVDQLVKKHEKDKQSITLQAKAVLKEKRKKPALSIQSIEDEDDNTQEQDIKETKYSEKAEILKILSEKDMEITKLKRIQKSLENEIYLVNNRIKPVSSTRKIGTGSLLSIRNIIYVMLGFFLVRMLNY